MAYSRFCRQLWRVPSDSPHIVELRRRLDSDPSLTARVTLGRALMEVGRVEEAMREFERVLQTDPDNVAATRAVAEIQATETTREPPVSPASATMVDFDALLRSLGVPDAAPPPTMERLLTTPAAPVAQPPPLVLELPGDPRSLDAFGNLERALRAFGEARAPAPTRTAETEVDDATTNEILDQLESWLMALQEDRSIRPW